MTGVVVDVDFVVVGTADAGMVAVDDAAAAADFAANVALLDAEALCYKIAVAVPHHVDDASVVAAAPGA